MRGLIALNGDETPSRELVDRRLSFLKADPRAGWASGVIAPQAFYIDLTAPHTNGR
jgi:hypothetical protein